MTFEIKVSQEQAENEVSNLLDKKMIFPKQRERMQIVIDAVVEGITLGFVAIDEEGKITQTLCTPVGNLSQLIYKARVEPFTMSKNIKAAKAQTAGERSLVYICSYTDQLPAAIEKMEPADRNIAEAISFFFQ